MAEEIQLSVLFYNLGRWSGIIGFTCLSLLIFSGDTARFFDRFLGLDRIIKFQRKFSLFTAFFVFLHPIFFIISNRTFARYLIPDFAIFPLALGAVSLYIFIVVLISSLIYKRISYNIWQYIHILTYLLFFFGLYHAINMGSFIIFSSVKILYGFLFLAIIIGIAYRTWYKIKERFKEKFYVEKIIKETNDTFSLFLKTKRKVVFKAGQFFFLRINKNNLYARHPFTTSSSPNEKLLRFTIKNTGRFTKTAFCLQRGEEVILDGPFGIFTLKDRKKDIVFIAGGVGITPFMSMIRNNLYSREKQNILLLYGSKTKEDIIFKDELNKIEEKWLKTVYILSKEMSPLSWCERGYINKPLIEKYVKNPKGSLFYICGPEIMKESSVKILLDLGVKKRDIFIEDFFW
ncbi:MAG: ferredoxin reductase family protein [Candidatus Pacebacteria bacterium]|nr:ferredoxin reductase family protein [Candidatus Paceibacterota bacterium]MDD4467049.1 ferredoxin reductase family protein [Candidatus Paceibacterota bacterium]